MPSEPPTFGSTTQTSFPWITGDKVAFLTTKDFKHPCLCHSQMVSCFERHCVIILWSALAFLHRCTDLLLFTKDFRGEGEFDEDIADFSQVLLRWDWPKRIEESLIDARHSEGKVHVGSMHFLCNCVKVAFFRDLPKIPKFLLVAPNFEWFQKHWSSGVLPGNHFLKPLGMRRIRWLLSQLGILSLLVFPTIK